MNLASIAALTNAGAGAAGKAASTPSKLHNAAQQFEALVISEMLRSEREAGSEGWMGSGEDSGDDSAMDMAEGQLSNALAAGGGLGLAKMIEKTMAHAVTANRIDSSSSVSNTESA